MLYQVRVLFLLVIILNCSSNSLCCWGDINEGANGNGCSSTSRAVQSAYQLEMGDEAATIYVTIKLICGGNVSSDQRLYLQDSACEKFDCSEGREMKTGSVNFTCTDLPLSKVFHSAVLRGNDGDEVTLVFTEPIGAVPSGRPSNDSKPFATWVVIMLVTCALVVLVFFSSMAALVIGYLALHKKKEKLSCEVIATQKKENTKSADQQEAENTKKTKEKAVWTDDFVTPPLPARTAEMFLFASPVPSSPDISCSSSSTVTVTVDIEDSLDSDYSPEDHQCGRERETHCTFTPDRSQGSSSACKQFYIENTLQSSTHHGTPDSQCLKTAHSYENTPQHTPTMRYENVNGSATTRYENVNAPATTRYENVTDSHDTTTHPPPIPPRPQPSNHAHHHVTTPTHKLSPLVTTSIHHHTQHRQCNPDLASCASGELAEADRFRFELSNHKREGDSCTKHTAVPWPAERIALRTDSADCDDHQYVAESLEVGCQGDVASSSEESLDMWPPPIPPYTREMHLTAERVMGREGEGPVREIDMKENEAYNTFSNVYVVHCRH